MDQNTSSEHAESGGAVMPVRANDPPFVVAAHTVWNRMIENHSLDVKKACEETGVPRWQFYKALKSEVVQGEVAQWLDVMRAVEAKLLKDNWFDVLAHQIDIARGHEGDARTAVQAARFLDGIRQRIEEQTEDIASEEDADDFSFLKKFASAPTKKRYMARRTRKTGPGETVSEELVVEGEGEMIEG